MHNGFYIVKLEGCDIDTVAEYKNHGSLAYGIDWYKALDRGNWCREVEDSLDDSSSPKQSLLASCSFYDRSLHLWQCYLWAEIWHNMFEIQPNPRRKWSNLYQLYVYGMAKWLYTWWLN
jgi:hypothetical protein